MSPHNLLQALTSLSSRHLNEWEAYSRASCPLIAPYCPIQKVLCYGSTWAGEKPVSQVKKSDVQSEAREKWYDPVYTRTESCLSIYGNTPANIHGGVSVPN